MKSKTGGKYMFLGNVNAMFGPGMRFAETLNGLKLKAYEKTEIKTGVAALYVARNEKIVRINVNGVVRG